MQDQLILHGPTWTQNPTLCTPYVLSFRTLTPPGLGVTCISCRLNTCQTNITRGDLEDLPAVVGLKGTAAHSEPEIAPGLVPQSTSQDPQTTGHLMKHETTTMFDGFSSITEHVNRTSDFCWWVEPHVFLVASYKCLNPTPSLQQGAVSISSLLKSRRHACTVIHLLYLCDHMAKGYVRGRFIVSGHHHLRKPARSKIERADRVYSDMTTYYAPTLGPWACNSAVFTSRVYKTQRFWFS